MEKIIYINESLYYYLERKRIKNVYLRVIDNQIHISAPILYPISKINDFVISKLDLIEKHQNKEKKEFFKDDKVMLFDEYVDDYEYNRFMINESLRYIKERTFYYYKLMNLGDTLPSVYIKDIKSAYGIYHKNTHFITFNKVIFHYKKEIIDYVVIHELAHIKYFDHSKNFWSFVAMFCPNYKVLRKELKK